jgi:ribosomal protein S27AE
MFGLDRKAKWPAEGMPPRMVQGVLVAVDSLAEAKANKRFHRARAQCPQCGHKLSAGRLAQHVCPVIADNLNQGFIEAVYGPMLAVWQAIAEEGIEADNAEAIEMVLDADRLTTFGYPEADKLVDAAIKAHDYLKVAAFLEQHVQLV